MLDKLLHSIEYLQSNPPQFLLLAFCFIAIILAVPIWINDVKSALK